MERYKYRWIDRLGQRERKRARGSNSVGEEDFY
jgi:hypothetical protein